MKKLIGFILVFLMTITSTGIASAGTEEWNQNKYAMVDAAIHDTAKYLLKNVPAPSIASIGGEWSIIGLKASGYDVPKEYWSGYYKRVENTLKENGGILNKNKYTEYSRLILALTAMGKDVTNVGGYNLLEKLADFENIIKQGINGPTYALIALDSHHYQIPKVAGVTTQATRQMLVDYILALETVSDQGIKGGYSLNQGTWADPDITGMVIQALSNYMDQPKVKASVDRSLQVLASMENSDGTYLSWGTLTSVALVQVIVAKASLGLNCDKNVNGLLKYYKNDAGFEHVPGDGGNLLATEQCMYALSAYKLMIAENRGLYNLDHVILSKGDEVSIILNGRVLEFEQVPLIIDGRVLVPMRAIFEELGAKVFWDGALRQVTGEYGTMDVKLIIGDKVAYLNGMATTLDVPAKIVNGRTLVPLRFIAQSLDYKVDWDSINRTVTIDKKDSK